MLKSLLSESTCFGHLFIYYLFPDKVSLCNNPDCPGSCFVDQAGHILTEIPLPLPPKSWD